MKTLSVLLLISLTWTVSRATIDVTNRKIVRAVCFKDVRTQTMDLDMYIDFNGNPVDRVLALSSSTYLNTDGTNNAVACTMNDINQGYVHVKSRVSLSGLADSNRCGARRLSNTDIFEWVYEVRATFSDGIYVGIDRRYFLRCDYGVATSLFATAQINVIGDDFTGTSTRLRPQNTMTVLRQSGNTFLSTETVQLNENVKLAISSEVTTQESSLDPHGLYAFSCSFGPLPVSERTLFIQDNGCPVTSNIFGLVNGFRSVAYSALQPVSALRRQFNTETQSFVMASPYPTNDFYYFNCYVDYCYGLAGSDAKCNDFCDLSRTGRKKRSVNVADLDQIIIGIRVVNGSATTTATNDVETESQQSSSSKTAIIVASSVASVVFLIIVFIVVVLVCCRQGCCYAGGKDDLISDTSSERTMTSRKLGSMAYPPPSLVQAKA